MIDPVDCYTPSNWLIIVRRHTAAKVDIEHRRIVSRIVACWERMRMLPPVRDGQLAGSIADDQYSWLLLFLDRPPHEHSRASAHKRCVFVHDVRPSKPHDFLHLPANQRPHHNVINSINAA